MSAGSVRLLNITLVLLLFIFRPNFVLRECKSFSICCSSVGFFATRIISSAKRRLLLMYIFLVIFMPYCLSPHSRFLKMDCKHYVNSLGDMWDLPF